MGFLVISWVAIAGMWIKEKFLTHDQRLDYHDDRLIELEKHSEEAIGQRQEMLNILRGLQDVG